MIPSSTLLSTKDLPSKMTSSTFESVEAKRKKMKFDFINLSKSRCFYTNISFSKFGMNILRPSQSLLSIRDPQAMISRTHIVGIIRF